MLDILPGIAKRHNRSFCCKSHYHLSKVGKKWTAKILKYVQENILKEAHEVIAKKVGASVPSLRRQITIWRNEGKDIPYTRKNIAIGSIGHWTYKGITCEFIKTVAGWEKVKRLTPYKPRPKKEKVIKERIIRVRKIKEPKPRKVIVKKEPLNRITMRKPPKPAEKKFVTREFDMSQYKYVRVDSKTVVLRKIA